MVVGLLGNESSDSNRFTLVTPKSENDVRLQATLENQNPTGLPVGAVSTSAPQRPVQPVRPGSGVSTGDETNIWMWISVMAVAGLGIVLGKKKKENR